MSVENGKVCCNCRHNNRERDKKYGITICICEVCNKYMSYTQVMDGWCRHWAKEKSQEESEDKE